MELIIKEITIPEVIEFNFEELKQEITARSEQYKTAVYSEAQIKEAKADRANLNKFVKVLSDERIKVKKQCLKPYEEFEKKVNELSKIVEEPIGIIDAQVKKFEEEQKIEKEKEITNYFLSLYEGSDFVPEWLKLEQIFNDKWLNASTSMKSIQDEISDRINQINSSMATLSTLPEYSFEAVEVFKTNLDINKAILEAQRMSQIAKMKAEAEAQAKALEEAVNAIEEAPEPIPEPVVEQNEIEKQWVTFKALLSTEDAMALKDFFRSRNIEFTRG